MKDSLECDDETVIVGHSSGAEACMRFAEKYKVKGMVLVSACVSDLGDENERASGYYSRPWPWAVIVGNVDGFVRQFGSTDDPYIPWAEMQQMYPVQRTNSWVVLVLQFFSPCFITADQAAKQAHDWPTLSASIERSLSPPGKGFHLEIVTEVSSNSSEWLVDYECSLTLNETLPSGLYIDLFQLANLEPFGGPRVRPEGSMDIEAPEFESTEVQLVVDQLMKNVDGRLTCRVAMPVHLRYHKAVSGGVEIVFTMKDPVGSITCSKGNNVISLRLDLNSQSELVTFRVPRGDTDSSIVIVVVTLLACLVGMAMILSAFYAHCQKNHED